MNTSLKNLFTIRNGLVHIYGQPISRHETYPWLYCANDIHKALVKRAGCIAEKKGKDVTIAKSKVTAKLPSVWIKRKVNDCPDTWNKEINLAGKSSLQKYFNVKSGSDIKNNLLKFNWSNPDQLKMRDVAIQTKPGRYGGTYLCSQLIIAYCEWTSPQFANRVRQIFFEFTDGDQELHEELDKNHNRAKGTQTRQESKDNWPDWKKWNSDHSASYIVTTGVITNEVLGKSKAKYMEEHGIGEPFRDNISVSALDMINSAQTLTIQLGDQLNSSGQHEVNAVAMRAGNVVKELGRVSSLDKLDKLLSVIRSTELE